MEPADRVVIACSCEGTMPLDQGAIRKGCSGDLHIAHHLCRHELDLVKSAISAGAPVTVSCTQEAPLFTEVAGELNAQDRIDCVNIREFAGWSRDAKASGPKMAALLAAAAEPSAPVSLVSLVSRGVTLVYGCDDAAVAAAARLADHLNITVLLKKPDQIAPPKVTAFPILQGAIANARGHLGAFELRIDDYAVAAPSSRRALVFGAPRNGVSTICDLILDLSGERSLFPAPELRSGYLRADPRDPVSVERALFALSHLVGEFDKPRFIDFDAGLCVHSRSRITGCTRCLDLCPTGAITPVGDHVAIDPHICAGCGSCSSVCPTGAAAYALPYADALIRKLRTLMRAYHAAGGKNGIVLFHDADHGEPLIFALARFGEGLPPNVIPVRVNEVSQVGLEAVTALFAYGAAGARFVTRSKPKHDIGALERTVVLSNTLLEGLGYGSADDTEVVSIIPTDDPDELSRALGANSLATVPAIPASFMTTGAKRNVLEFSLRELHRVAPRPVDVVPLAQGAPFGGLEVRVEGCTLCLACASACPTQALRDDPDRPMLRFVESLCVQCGLCAATCPEHVIQLKPQIDFAAWRQPARVIKEEEPFHCIACGKAFGTRSSIERVIAKLKGRHWMFSGSAGEDRLRVLSMCEDCRVESVMNESFDPHNVPLRPRPRTTEDYLRERAEGKDDLA